MEIITSLFVLALLLGAVLAAAPETPKLRPAESRVQYGRRVAR